MAVQELLRSSYTGSLGETTGTKWKTQDVVKGKIWSKTPNNETQTNSVRAFEALNRVASAIAKKWFYWLGIKAVNMHKHNAIAHLLKGCVAHHAFNIYGISVVFPNNGTVEIGSSSVDFETGLVSFSASTTFNIGNNKNQSWLVLVFKQDGTVLLCETPPTKIYSATFYAPVVDGDEVYFMALSSERVNGKYILGGSSLPVYVINGRFYTSRVTQSIWEYVGDGRARAVGTGVSYSGGKVIVTG